MPENSTFPRSLNKSTMPILIALFAIRMVANNFLGFSRSRSTMEALGSVRFSNSFISVGVKPKKATSAPETRAEQIIKKTKIPIFKLKKELAKANKGTTI